MLVPSPMPSWLDYPTVAPTAVPTADLTYEKHRADDATNQLQLVCGLLAGCLILLAICVVFVRHGTGTRCGIGLNKASSFGGTSSNQESLLRQDGFTIIEIDSVELVERSVMIRSYEKSPAPVFVVGRDSMRVSLWSPGMAIAAPMVRNPLGGLLSDLPFVNASDGDQLDQFLRRIFEAPAEHDAARTYMLHLRNRHRNVLLEMVATHFHVRDSEPIIVMTGRQVDSDLAVLLSCGTAVAASEANHDVNAHGAWGESSHLQSVSQAGSIKGDDDDDDMLLPINDREDDGVSSSVVSTLTMSTFKPLSKICGGSTVSSLTTPTMTPGPSLSSLPMRTFRSPRPPPPSAARAAAEAYDRAGRDCTVARGKTLRHGSDASSSGDDDDDSAQPEGVFVDRSELSDLGSTL